MELSSLTKLLSGHSLINDLEGANFRPRWLTVSVLLALTTQVFSVNIVFPIEPEASEEGFWSFVKKEEKAGLQKLIFSKLSSSEPAPISKILSQKQKHSLNGVQLDRLSRIYTDHAQGIDLDLGKTSIFVPEICRVEKSGYLFIDEIDMDRFELASSRVFVISDFNVPDWLSQKDPRKAGEAFVANLKSILSSWDQAANFSTASFAKSPLKLAMTLAKGTPSEDCIHSWYWRKLATQYRVYPYKTRQKARLLESMFQTVHPPMQANRQVLYTIDKSLTKETKGGSTFNLKGVLSDGVFGTPLDVKVSPLVLSINGVGELTGDLSAFTTMLVDQERILGSDGKLPQIVSVNGAWGYLDKGLGYGLRIRDRLVATSEKGPVEAHVIGYFGPKLGLKTSNGSIIPEGAIVYTRKNQVALRKGLEFTYDTKKFGE